MNIDLMTDPYACMMYIVSPLAGLGGPGHIVAASRLQLVIRLQLNWIKRKCSVIRRTQRT